MYAFDAFRLDIIGIGSPKSSSRYNIPYSRTSHVPVDVKAAPEGEVLPGESYHLKELMPNHMNDSAITPF